MDALKCLILDFTRPIAVGALLTTMVACILTIIQIRKDVTSGHYNFTNCNLTMENNDSGVLSPTNSSELHAEFSTPTAYGYFEAFGSIMFAFGGASTFPTIQVRFQYKIF